MKTLQRWMVLIPASVLLLATACSSSGSSPTAPGTQAPAGSQSVAVTLDQWSIVPAATTLPAGSVTFTVTNIGDREHEFVVLQTDTPAADLVVGSFEGESGRVDEDTAGTNVGETGDLAAGTTGTVTISLQPGHYVFVCNLPGHYTSGMHTDFTVS